MEPRPVRRVLWRTTFLLVLVGLGAVCLWQWKRIAAVEGERDAALAMRQTAATVNESGAWTSERRRGVEQNAAVRNPLSPPPNEFIEAAKQFDSLEFQNMLKRDLRLGVERRYAAFFRRAKLGQGESDQLISLLVEQQMRGIDVLRAAQAAGMDSRHDSSTTLRLLKDSQEEFENNIQKALNPSRYAEFRQYSDNILHFELLEQLERRFEQSANPLTAAQSDVLLNALISTAATRGAESDVQVPATFLAALSASNPLVAGAVQPQITDQTIIATNGVLSPAQQEILKTFQLEQAKHESFAAPK